MTNKILIADDKIVNRVFCQMAIKRESQDFEFELFENSDSLVKRLNEPMEGVPLAIVDDHMPPGLDGNEIIKEYAPKYPKTRFILYSSSEPEIGIRAVKEYGAFAYLPKPADKQIFTDTIRRALDLK